MESILKSLLRIFGCRVYGIQNNTFNLDNKFQNKILTRLLDGTAVEEDFMCANNITRARYANVLWKSFGDKEKCHFMFHTEKRFNGFSDGVKQSECEICNPKTIRNLNRSKINQL